MNEKLQIRKEVAMKNCILLLVMGSLLVFFTADIVLADWYIQFDAEANRVLHLGGQTKRGSFATKEQCQAYWKSQPSFERQHSWCVGYDGSSSTSWGTTAPAGGLSSSEQMAVGIFGSLFSGLMQDLMAPPPSYQQQRKQQQEAEAAKIRQKELERQHQIQRWREFQNEQRRQRDMERAEEEQRIRGLLAKMQIPGSDESLGMESMAGGKLEAFKWERPEAEELELQALGRGRYDTSTLSEWQRLLCAAHFSREALIAIKNGDEVRARYLNEQAEKVSSGQMIELECKFPALPQPPEPEKAESKMTAYANLLSKVQKDIKTLQDIEIKIKQTEVKKKQAESKKAKAKKKIEESHALDTAKPEDKAKAKTLKDQAQILLQEAQNEIELAKKTHEELLEKRDEIQDDLEQMQRKIELKDEVN